MDATGNSSTPVKEKSTLLDKKKQPRTVRDVVFDVSTGISNAILAVLGMGLLMASLGNLLHITPLVQAGLMGQKMLAPHDASQYFDHRRRTHSSNRRF